MKDPVQRYLLKQIFGHNSVFNEAIGKKNARDNLSEKRRQWLRRGEKARQGLSLDRNRRSQRSERD